MKHLDLVLPSKLTQFFSLDTRKSLPKILLPGLEAILARSDYFQSGKQSEITALQKQFGLFEGQNQPACRVAPITYLVDVAPDSTSYILRADPVHLQVDRDAVVLLGNEQLDISKDEAIHIANEINAHFCEESWTIIPASAKRWYIRLSRNTALNTSSIDDVMGQNINNYMPGGDDGLYWRQVMNEIQMLLHRSDVNKQRQSNGEPAINSIWLWGGGVLPPPQPVSWGQVYGDDVLLEGLAKLCRVPYSMVPDNYNGMPGLVDGIDSSLLVFNATRFPSISDHDELGDYMHAMERDWFKLIFSALKSSSLGSLDINLDRHYFSTTSKVMRSWWKRKLKLDMF
ncbi:MAG: hypothetical protein ACE5EH_06880 [Gammaproteobacteria bacterium]